MSPVVRPKLVNKILDMEVDGRFGDRQPIGDLLVSIAIANQPKNLELAFRRIIVSEMFGEAGGYLGWNMPLAGVNGADERAARPLSWEFLRLLWNRRLSLSTFRFKS